ncbi:MAG TPA: Fe-S cluster assembly protein SufD [Gemmatimonadaceae bacterium]|nr:Fe-S cluster assembly protein SufD [Gemmatimonadaceae bacterium]
MTTTASAAAPAAFLAPFDGFATGEGAQAPAPVQALRRAALDRFAELGFPTTKNEDWHFTSVAPIAEGEFLLLTAPGGEVKRADLLAHTFGHDEWYTAVFVNGRFDAALSTLAGLPAGVRVLPLAEAFAEVPELVERHLGRVTSYEEASFTALNTAYLHDGVVVHVARNVVVDRPIHLLFMTDALAARGMMHPRLLVVVERGAEATLLESYVATGDAHYFTNSVGEVVVEEGATLRHLKVQRESLRAHHVGTTEVVQARDSHYHHFLFGTGAALSRTNVYTTLGGEGCGATLNGLYLLDGAQHLDTQTRIAHQQPNCYSRELYKGILDGTSHGVFNGKVYVDPIAQKTDGKQTNNTLLLSERAQIDTKPQLEIFADDVKCTHGATVGRLDQTSLFYMKSRGVSDALARQLLTYAFAADVLETIELDAVKEGLESLTLKRYTTDG